MLLGRVVGQVVATRKHEALVGYRLLCIRPHGFHEPAHPVDLIIAVDVLGAGPGEDVVVCFGEPARRCSRDTSGERQGFDLPIEAAVAAIVDSIDLDPAVIAGLRRPLHLRERLQTGTGA